MKYKDLKLVKKKMHGIYNHDEVSKILLKIIERYPKCSEAYYLLGKVTSSIHYLDIAIILKPNYCDAYYYRAFLKGMNHDRQGDYEDLRKTLKYINKSKNIYSLDMQKIYSKLGYYEKIFGDVSKAIEYFSKAISLSDSFEDYFERGRIYLEIGDYSKSLDDFNHSILLKPSHSRSYLFRAQVKNILGDEKGSQEDLELSSHKLFEFEDVIDGQRVKKLFKRNIISTPSYFESENKNSWTCPNCQSKRIANYIYGLPIYSAMSDETKKAVSDRKIIFAGCLAGPKSPAYICRDCGTEFVNDFTDSQENNEPYDYFS